MKDTTKQPGMQNRLFCVVVLALVFTGAVYAQEDAEEETAAEEAIVKESGPKKNVLTLDLLPLLKGFIAADSDADIGFFCLAVGYERQIAPHYTIGVDLDLYPGKLDKDDYMYFGLAATARFYPMSEYMEKLFLGVNFGFNVLSIDGDTDPEDGGFVGLLVSLKAGYKLLLGKNISIEPSMSYVYSKTSEYSFFMPSVTPLGWQAGLRVGILF